MMFHFTRWRTGDSAKESRRRFNTRSRKKIRGIVVEGLLGIGAIACVGVVANALVPLAISAPWFRA